MKKVKSRPIIIEIPINSNYCEQDFMEFVYDYFNGFELEYTVENGYYRLAISREDFLYCENFDKVFQQIGIEISNANNYYYSGEKSSIFFSDAWFYYVVVNYYTKQYNKLRNIVIIHIDDHRDMMDPFIGFDGNSYVNLLSQKKVDLLNLDDAFDLVNSGSITIGSMMTPILFGLDKIKIIHLSNAVAEPQAFSINKTTISDELFPQNKRLHLNIEQAKLGNAIYYNVNNPNEVVGLIDINDLVLLHFDMDYFNNRYNGSSDWQFGTGHHNPGIEEQLIMMDNITEVLRKITKKSSIAHTAIGISPSFYPSEFWINGIKYLLNSLESINVDVKEIKKELIGKGWLD